MRLEPNGVNSRGRLLLEEVSCLRERLRQANTPTARGWQVSRSRMDFAHRRDGDLGSTQLLLELVEQPDGMSNFRLLSYGVLRNFPFDGQRAGVTDFREGTKVAFHAHIALPERDLLPPFDARLSGPFPILAVDAADILPNLAQGGQRFSGSVQDHVGRIKVDEQVVSLDITDELQQGVGRLLSRLQMQGLAISSTMVTQVTGDFQDFGIERIVSVVRDEAEVQSDDFATE